MKITTIIGARPQFIKAAVISRAIARHNETCAHPSQAIHESIVHTGQHYDRSMSDIFFEELQIPEPALNLCVTSLRHAEMTGMMLAKIETVLIDDKPDWVLVYGDTNSTLAGALAAAKLNIPVAHVEAGLRSYNRRMPEEINRVVTDHISQMLFCPTGQSIANLKREGIAGSGEGPIKIQAATVSHFPFVAQVGDVMLDAVLHYRSFAKKPTFSLPDKFILATVHRAENTDHPEKLANIFKTLKKISAAIPVVLPLHPRTRKNIDATFLFQSNAAIHFVEPVGYLEMLFLIDNCSLVMTDSGGLQKEAFFCKKPCITLREETEWVELVEIGCNCVAGTDPQKIEKAFTTMHKKIVPENLSPFGEGNSGVKIIELLKMHCL